MVVTPRGWEVKVIEANLRILPTGKTHADCQREIILALVKIVMKTLFKIIAIGERLLQ